MTENIATTTLRGLQRQAVDGIKRHAIGMTLRSPRAEARVLTEYLWSEEAAESGALESAGDGAPRWLARLTANQLADERRHALLLRERLAAIGLDPGDRPPPAVGRIKLWWLERTAATYGHAFAAGPIVGVLAVAAQLESTGVRMFGRHLDVLEAAAPDAPTAAVLRSILADERRHARSCAAALDRLVTAGERPALEALRARVARIDRAFGVTISVAFWAHLASLALRDRAAVRRPR